MAVKLNNPLGLKKILENGDAGTRERTFAGLDFTEDQAFNARDPNHLQVVIASIVAEVHGGTYAESAVKNETDVLGRELANLKPSQGSDFTASEDSFVRDQTAFNAFATASP